MNFTISNHPYAPTIKREVKLTGMSIDILNCKLVLNLLIKHYVDDVYLPEMDKALDSIANNNHTFPHPYGQGEIGEFDYWMFLYNNNLPLSTMLSNGVANIDATGLINRKCEYAIPSSLITTTTTTTEYIEETTTTTEYVNDITTTEYIESTTTTTTEYVEETTTTTTEYVEETTTTTEYIEPTTTTEYTTTEYFEETTTTTTEFPVEETTTTTTEYIPEAPLAPKKSFWSIFRKS